MAKYDRFQVVQHQGNSLTSPSIMVLLDTVTGVQYLYVKEGYGGGMCPLLGKDGKPLIRDV